ncbi:UNVERIFIED_CONTAM: hypothetical protein GTU68_016736, partial [Idotea baltica]|nr:hypothetical protein [Idotea baltica]
LTSLIPTFGNVAYTLIFFVIALSVIVAIHEYGHYIVGRWSGIHAEVFSIGFGKVIYSRTDKRGTVWQIAALPFGGYVRFLGDANAASMSDSARTHMATLSDRNTMLGAPLWARSATVAAGPIFNFILSFLMFAGVLLYQGQPPQPALVQSITPRSAADDAGLKIGDVIVSMNGTPVYQFGDMVDVVEQTREQPIALEIWRDGQMITDTLTPRLVAIPQPDGSMRDEPKLGIRNGGLFFEPATTDVGVGEAVRLAAQQVWFLITQSLNGLKQMMIGNINTCNLSGPLGIAEMSGSMASQGTLSFISFIAVLSTGVGLLNLFPIPVLDGGHLVFHAYEAVTGKMPSDGALRIFMAIGIALIGTLMVFAIGNDLLFCP